MRGPLVILGERVAEQLPGWMFVAVGMSLLGAAVLAPAWWANRDLRWQHAVMRQQAERMEAQAERYAEFEVALAADDPQLIQRLAYSQLHYRPADGEPWIESDARWASYGADRLAMSASVDAALAEPAANLRPAPLRDRSPSRLVRLATGTSRLGLLAAALLFVLGGLCYRGKPAEQPAQY